MMNVLLLGYIAILALFVWLGLIPFNRFWKALRRRARRVISSKVTSLTTQPSTLSTIRGAPHFTRW